MGPIYNRLVCNKVELPSGTVLLLGGGRQSYIRGYSEQLESQRKWICQPTVFPYWENPATNRDVTLIIPAWTTASWWPQMLELLVELPILLPHKKDLFRPPKRVGINFVQKAPPWATFAVKISGRSSKRRAFRKRCAMLLRIDGRNRLRKIMTQFGGGGRTLPSAERAIRSFHAHLSCWSF